MSYKLDTEKCKVVFTFTQEISFKELLSAYAEQAEDIPDNKEDTLKLIDKIAAAYDNTADFGWDDEYLEDAICEMLSNDDEKANEEDDEEDEEDDEAEDGRITYEIDSQQEVVTFSDGRMFHFKDILDLLHVNGYKRPITKDELAEIVAAVAEHFAYLCDSENGADATENYLEYGVSWMLMNTEIGDAIYKCHRDR